MKVTSEILRKERRRSTTTGVRKESDTFVLTSETEVEVSRKRRQRHTREEKDIPMVGNLSPGGTGSY